MEAGNVNCKKLGRVLPAMPKPPFKGPIGDKIFENISADAWKMWEDMQIKVINEYRLNLGDKRDYETLVDQMLAFLNLKEGVVAEVENVARGKAQP